jgi:hypothetical protein
MVSVRTNVWNIISVATNRLRRDSAPIAVSKQGIVRRLLYQNKVVYKGRKAFQNSVSQDPKTKDIDT